jgi:integrase
MAVRQIRHSWWVDFRSGHTRYRKRSPENSRAGAKAYEASLRHRLARGEQLDAKKSEEQTFAQFAEAWFTGYVVINNKPSEQRAKQQILRASLIPFFGKMRLDAIGKKDIEHFKAHEQRRGNANKTINNKLAVLRKCLATAYDWEAMRNPPPKIQQLRCRPPVTEFLTPEEADRLLDETDGILHETVLVALRTGLRQGEILGLQWEAIDWENRILTVRHSLFDHTLTAPKSNRERHVPLSGDLYQVLRARRKSTGYVFTNRDQRPIRKSAHYRSLKRAQRKAGLRSFGWHALRHTFATHLVAKGVQLRTVQELLGHTTITMTTRYAHVGASSLRAAVDLLSTEEECPLAFGQPVGNTTENARASLANA